MKTFSIDTLYNHDKVQKAVLWKNGCSTCNGMNDRIRAEEAEPLINKYLMITVDKLTLHVVMEGNKKKIRAQFRYEDAPYKLLVVDPLIREKYLQLEPGNYLIQNPEICVMLGLSHTFNGYRYKIVKSIMGEC